MDVEYRPPAIGSHHVPIKITGPGTLDLREDGLHVVGAEVASKGRALIIVLGLLAFGGVMALGKMVFGLSTWFAGGVAGAVGVGILIPALRKPAKAGARVEQLFPWKNVRTITYDASLDCLVIVIKGMKPKGGLFVVQEKGSELQKQLEEKLG